MNRGTILISVLFLLALSHRARTEERSLSEEQIVARIKELGGRVWADDKPGNPVTTVFFHGRKITDDAVKPLRGLQDPGDG